VAVSSSIKIKVAEVTVHPELTWVGVIVNVAVGEPTVGVAVGEPTVGVGEGVKVRVGVKVGVEGPGVQVGPQGGNCTLVVAKSPVWPATEAPRGLHSLTGSSVTESPRTSVRIKV
jgi:hypothetical protein